MYPQIFLDGPGAELPSAGAAVLSLHRRLIDRFGGQQGLERAYAEVARRRQDANLTPFEIAFRELASEVHARTGLPDQSQFFFEIRS